MMRTTMYNMWRKSNVKLQNSQLFKITVKWGHKNIQITCLMNRRPCTGM